MVFISTNTHPTRNGVMCVPQKQRVVTLCCGLVAPAGDRRPQVKSLPSSTFAQRGRCFSFSRKQHHTFIFLPCAFLSLK